MIHSLLSRWFHIFAGMIFNVIQFLSDVSNHCAYDDEEIDPFLEYNGHQSCLRKEYERHGKHASNKIVYVYNMQR